MATKTIKITDEEIVGSVRAKEKKMPTKKLIEYILRYGFEYNEVWYFRKSWMSSVNFLLLRQGDLIKKVGTHYDLRVKGFPIPFSEVALGCHPIFYYFKSSILFSIFSL